MFVNSSSRPESSNTHHAILAKNVAAQTRLTDCADEALVPLNTLKRLFSLNNQIDHLVKKLGLGNQKSPSSNPRGVHNGHSLHVGRRYMTQVSRGAMAALFTSNEEIWVQFPAEEFTSSLVV